MELCSSGHEEVCYESRNCPVCEKIDEKDEEITELNERINELESENQDLAAEVEANAK